MRGAGGFLLAPGNAGVFAGGGIRVRFLTFTAAGLAGLATFFVVFLAAFLTVFFTSFAKVRFLGMGVPSRLMAVPQ